MREADDRCIHCIANDIDSGTYCKDTDTGGSNGAGMRYEQEGGDPANAGLQHARVFLEPIKEKHSWITYSDCE